MPVEVKFDETDCIVNVVYSGTATLEERKNAADVIRSLYSNMRPLQILVNVKEHEIDLAIDLTMEEQESFGKYLATHYGLTHARIAVLHKENDNPNVFVHHFASSDGYKLALFSSEKDALDWLKEK